MIKKIWGQNGPFLPFWAKKCLFWLYFWTFIIFCLNLAKNCKKISLRGKMILVIFWGSKKALFWTKTPFLAIFFFALFYLNVAKMCKK